MKNKTIFFRFDVGGTIGMGHFGRVSTLSDAFAKYGFTPIWLVRKRPSTESLIFKYETHFLPPIADTQTTNTSSWINKSEKNEFMEMLEIASPNLLFIDHYGLLDEFPILCLNSNIKVGIFIDFYVSKISANFALNYSLGAENLEDGYLSLNPNCQYFLGPKYAPISTSLTQKVIPEEAPLLKKIGVYLGGVNLDLHLKFYRLFKKISILKDCQVVWCITQPEVFSEIKKYENPNFTVIGAQENMNHFYQNVDCVIGGIGVSFLERSYVGVPQIVFRVADNQKDFSNILGKSNLAFYGGDLVNSSEEEILNNLKELSLKKLNMYAKKASVVYDGLGQNRFVEKFSSFL